MSELTLLLLQIGFLILLWFFIFALVYSLRADLFGVKVRKMPEPAAAAPGPIATAPANAETSIVSPIATRPAAPKGPQKATTQTVSNDAARWTKSPITGPSPNPAQAESE